MPAQYRGVQVGTVHDIESPPGEQAAIHLAIDADRLAGHSADVNVNIASPTVFGAKTVQLTLPENPAAAALRPGQVLDNWHVMVGSTRCSSVGDHAGEHSAREAQRVAGAIAAAMNGRGHQFGQVMSDLNSALGQMNPRLSAQPRSGRRPAVFGAYADAAPNPLTVVQSATRIGDSIVDTQRDLDAALVSVTGLG